MKLHEISAGQIKRPAHSRNPLLRSSRLGVAITTRFNPARWFMIDIIIRLRAGRATRSNWFYWVPNDAPSSIRVIRLEMVAALIGLERTTVGGSFDAGILHAKWTRLGEKLVVALNRALRPLSGFTRARKYEGSRSLCVSFPYPRWLIPISRDFVSFVKLLLTRLGIFL